MELSERKKAILGAIIKTYIATGEPIGSKILCDILDNAPSSATLRNEMSALVQMGYLEQPHTSAGRVPTSSGYRFYIDSLMPKAVISDEERAAIDKALNATGCDPERLPEKAAEILSEITGLPTISANISNGGPQLKRVDILPMGSRSGMIIIITSDGRSRSRLCHIPYPLTGELISRFEKLVRERILKKNIDDLTPALMQGIFAAAGADALYLMPLLSSLFEMIADIRDRGVSMAGQANLFNMFRQKSDADKVIALINRPDALLSVLSHSDSPLEIVFGKDTGYSALEPSSLIIAKYGTGGKREGCIGIIGPTRMSYEQIIPSIEYTAERLGELLGEALKDMEE